MHPPTVPSRSRVEVAGHNGFTLPEMMLTVALTGILLTIGVPGLEDLAQNQRVSTQANELLGALQLARSEAIRRGVEVSVSAGGAGFEEGWCVHLGDECVDDDVLRVYPAPARLGLTQNATTIQFDDRGARRLPDADTEMAEITVQPGHCEGADAQRARVVEIGLSGRASVARAECS